MKDGLTEGPVEFDMFIQEKAYHAKYVTFLSPLNAMYSLRHRLGPKLPNYYRALVLETHTRPSTAHLQGLRGATIRLVYHMFWHSRYFDVFLLIAEIITECVVASFWRTGH